MRGLNNVWYGSYKFCANLTRFSKGQRKDHSEEDRVVKKPALDVQNRLSHNRTYAEVVRLQVVFIAGINRSKMSLMAEN